MNLQNTNNNMPLRHRASSAQSKSNPSFTRCMFYASKTLGILIPYTRAVSDPVMPIGVEHPTANVSSKVRSCVSDPVMPIGVEHIS